MRMNLRNCSIIVATALAAACMPAFASGPGGGGGGGGATAPAIINYKITGTIVGPGGCVGGVHPGFEEACTAFPTGRAMAASTG